MKTIRPFNVNMESYKPSIAKAYRQSNPNIFFHFSLTGYTVLKDINGNGTISFFLSKPDDKSIELLRDNEFTMYGKSKSNYFIYYVNLADNLDKIKYFYIASVPQEEELLDDASYRKESYKGRARLLKRKYGIETYFTNYEKMMENIDTEWLDFSYYANLQIENSKIYPEYKNLYAACIPHLLIGVEKYAELTIESTESIKRY